MEYKIIISSLLALVLGALCAFMVSRYGFKIALIDKPNERSSHADPTPRGGGIGLWLAFMLVGLFVTRNVLFTFIAGSMGLLGLLEDRFALSYRLRLLVQFGLAILMVYFFNQTSAHPSAVVVFLCWIVFIVGTSNFYNFMDGINGIAGLTGMIGFGLMAVFTWGIMHRPDISLMSTVLAFACLGFLPFNFPRARVFMGDVGSLFLGFVFASFVVQLSSKITIMLCLIMFLCTFYADGLLTFAHRWMKGENLMKAHRSHLYQYLCNELGLAHWKVSLIYASIQLTFGVGALFAYAQGLTWQVGFFVLFCLLFSLGYIKIKRIAPKFKTERATPKCKTCF